MGNDYETKDPSIIINFILTQLNDELLLNNDNNENKDSDPYDIFNEEKVVNDYWKNFNKDKATKIRISFYSTLKIMKNCKKCQNRSFSLEPFPIINVYLDQTNLLNELKFEHFNHHLVEKEKEMIKEECLICLDGEQEKFVTKDICNTAEILIININRNKDPKCLISFKYPEQFDMKEITKNDMEVSDYRLTAVIKKVNDDFIAFCWNFVDKQWYSYNKKIELVNNYKDNIFDDKNACILIFTGKKKKK